MSEEMSLQSGIPKMLTPYLVGAEKDAGYAPGRIVDLKAREAGQSRVKKKLADLADGPLTFMTTLGSFMASLTTGAFVVALGEVGYLWATIPLGLVATSGLSVLLVGDAELRTQSREHKWLEEQADLNLRGWVLKEFGVTVKSSEYDVREGDVFEFVNNKAPGRMRFIDGDGWELWRVVQDGPLLTDYDPGKIRQVITLRGTTKPKNLARKTFNGDEFEMFDREGRRLLLRAEELLKVLADIDDLDQAHRVKRADDIFNDALALAKRANSLSGPRKVKAMADVTLALKDAVRELESVQDWQDAQVTRDAALLAAYAGQVTNRPGSTALTIES